MTAWSVVAMMGLSSIPWTIILLWLTPTFGIRLFTVHNAEDCRRIQRRVSDLCTHYTEDNKGYGFSIGFYYLLHIRLERHSYGQDMSVWFIGTDASFRRLMDRDPAKKVVAKKVDTPSCEEPETMDVFERTGPFQNMYFYKRPLPTTILPKPRPAQGRVMENISAILEEQKRVVVFLHGSPGTGKSMLALLLARRLKATYCSTLKPWQPGDQLSDLYHEVEPTADHPLVIVFDEIDQTIYQIHDGIPTHPKIPICVTNKMGWNRMLDEIDWGLFPHLVVIMTSNQSPTVIHNLDPSYLRPGRVHLTAHLCFKSD